MRKLALTPLTLRRKSSIRRDQHITLLVESIDKFRLRLLTFPSSAAYGCRVLELFTFFTSVACYVFLLPFHFL